MTKQKTTFNITHLFLPQCPNLIISVKKKKQREKKRNEQVAAF